MQVENLSPQYPATGKDRTESGCAAKSMRGTEAIFTRHATTTIKRSGDDGPWHDGRELRRGRHEYAYAPGNRGYACDEQLKVGRYVSWRSPPAKAKRAIRYFSSRFVKVNARFRADKCLWITAGETARINSSCGPEILRFHHKQQSAPRRSTPKGHR